MPLTRNTLIRLKTIDHCLQNRYRKWTLQNLIDACSEALYEYEGRKDGVSRRTVQADIQLMRSEKLGYNAPIIVVDKKYYTYADPDYSITNIPLNDSDLHAISQAMDILKHFQTFSQFTAVNDVISKLEEHISVHISHHAPVIHMEKMPLLKGIEFIAPLYQYITQKQAVEIEYQTFKDEAILHFTMSPYLLKEYRNRWFVIGSCTLFPGEASTFALDRIQHLRPAPESCFVENRLFDPEHYFDHVIGVTRTLQSPSCHVELRFNADQAPYVLTKPMHTSQKLLRRYPDGSIDISLQVVHNYELEREIISYAEGVQVLQPASLRNNIQKRLQTAVSLYGENSTGNQHDFNSDSVTEEIPASNGGAKTDENQHDSNSALKTKPA